MLPNIRLMIAATFAAVLMLICGFSMFATFRVSHAPLERVASVASLHLVTTDAATPAMNVAAAAPFNNRFDVGGPGSGSVAALAYAAPEPAEPVETNVTAPAADDREPTAAEAASGDGPALSRQAAIAEAEPETNPEETPAAAAPPNPPADSTIALAAPSIAEPRPEPAAQTREPEVASAPATVEPAPPLPDLAIQAAEKAQQAEKAEKKARRAHAAVRTHRIHRTRVVARASGFGSPDHLPNQPALDTARVAKSSGKNPACQNHVDNTCFDKNNFDNSRFDKNHFGNTRFDNGHFGNIRVDGRLGNTCFGNTRFDNIGRYDFRCRRPLRQRAWPVAGDRD